MIRSGSHYPRHPRTWISRPFERYGGKAAFVAIARLLSSYLSFFKKSPSIRIMRPSCSCSLAPSHRNCTVNTREAPYPSPRPTIGYICSAFGFQSTLLGLRSRYPHPRSHSKPINERILHVHCRVRPVSALAPVYIYGLISCTVSLQHVLSPCPHSLVSSMSFYILSTLLVELSDARLMQSCKIMM